MSSIRLRRYGDQAKRDGQPLTDKQRAAAHRLQQYEILYHERRVGYVSTAKGAKVCLLPRHGLSEKQVAEVERHIAESFAAAGEASAAEAPEG